MENTVSYFVNALINIGFFFFLSKGAHADFMENFGDWNFDVLKLHEGTGGLSLQMVASHAVLALDLLPELRLRQSTF